jgi:hypothetical protein
MRSASNAFHSLLVVTCTLGETDEPYEQKEPSDCESLSITQSVRINVERVHSGFTTQHSPCNPPKFGGGGLCSLVAVCLWRAWCSLNVTWHVADCQDNCKVVLPWTAWQKYFSY